MHHLQQNRRYDLISVCALEFVYNKINRSNTSTQVRSLEDVQFHYYINPMC